MCVFAQEKIIDFDAVDSLYREDQFYIGLTYNKLQKTPSGLTQNKFSSGISLGFLRDMPFNKSRTWAVAVGVGYALNNYNQNLIITKLGTEYNYTTDSSILFDKNKISLHYVEVPLEIRWRNSIAESHKFWRIYLGFKASYLIYDRYKFTNAEGKIIFTGNKDLNEIQYGAYLALGWNTWNFYAYYGLSPLFKSAKVSEKKLDMNTLNLGLMFYIL